MFSLQRYGIFFCFLYFCSSDRCSFWIRRATRNLMSPFLFKRNYKINFYLYYMKRLYFQPHSSTIAANTIIRKWPEMLYLLMNMSWRSSWIPLWYFVFILHYFWSIEEHRDCEKFARPHRWIDIFFFASSIVLYVDTCLLPTCKVIINRVKDVRHTKKN